MTTADGCERLASRSDLRHHVHRAREGSFRARKGSLMREADIRNSLIATLELVHEAEPDMVIIEELGLCHGEGRVDVAAVNGLLSGYEIKSSSDTLTRLPRQVELYSRVMDTMSLVCAPRHLDAGIELIPDWWGVQVADGPRLEVERPDGLNPSPEPVPVLQLLWRDELRAIASMCQLTAVSRDNRRTLMSKLAGVLSLNEIRELTRHALKTREGWRVPRRPS